MKRLFFLLLTLGTLTTCQQNKQQLDLLITNASIIDLESGTVQEGQFIGILGDRIRVVDEMNALDQFLAEQEIDAADQFVIPGLWDNHVHFRGGEELIQENKDLLKLFLAHGVTSVRDAGGDMSHAVLEWKEQIAQGELDGPSIYSSGPKLDGPNPAWAGSIPIESPEGVSAALDSLQSLGTDFVKTYDGSLSPETYLAIVREAESRGLKVTGHMPLSTDLRTALEAGLDGLEHMYYFLPASSTIGDSLRALNRGYGILNALIQTHDQNLARQILEEVATNDFYLTPTLHIGQVLQNLYDQDHSSDSLLNYIGPGIIETYAGRERGAKNRSPEAQASYTQLQNIFNGMLVPAYESGIHLLAGSDCGASNSYVYPGASLHSELEQMVAAGLSPRQALRTSVVNGPKFFDLEEDYGNMAVGKKADLLILTDNPLEDIRHTRTIVAVIRGTKIYEQQKLHALLQSIRKD